MTKAFVWTVRAVLVATPIAYVFACSEETPQEPDPLFGFGGTGGGAGEGNTGGLGGGGGGGGDGGEPELDAAPSYPPYTEMCAAKGKDCVACCDTGSGAGGTAYLRFRDECLCKPGGACAITCGQSSLCKPDGGTPSQSCEDCKTRAIAPDAGDGGAGRCFSETMTACANDQSCADFRECIRGAACR